MADQESFIRHQEKIENKVIAMEKKMQTALKANKEKRENNSHGQHSRKADAEYKMQQLAKHVMEKFETSGKAVESFVKEQAHELMLKQEQRKLREVDMKKQSERMKRLELIHKAKVLDSEKTSMTRIKQLRDRDQALI